jgi:hypothetical protein
MSEYSDKLKSIGFLSRGQTRSREHSGRSHPDSGLPFKATTDELGATVTEHGEPGSAVSSRQDVDIRPDVVRGHL